MAEDEKEVLLMLADISGYTRFLADNRGTLRHAQIVITELLRAVLREAKLPFRVSKLEGDAIFFYLEIKGNEKLMDGMGEHFCQRLDSLFTAFHAKAKELIESNTCPCPACDSVAALRLKMIIHSGKALFYRLDRFTELSGVDVIVAHRLLKNSVERDEYVLITETAARTLKLSASRTIKAGCEEYENLGRIETLLYLPDTTRTAPLQEYSSPWYRFKTRWVKQWSVWRMNQGWLRLPAFRHLPSDI